MFAKPGLVALVTGGASGLGEASVRELFKNQYKVVIGDLDVERGSNLVKELASENVIFVETDVTKEESIKNLISKTLQTFGAIHVVLTSAGVAPEGDVFDPEQTPASQLIKTFQINVFGTFWVVQHASAAMIKQEPYTEKGERGVIIMVSSGYATMAPAKKSVYGGTKGAINGFTLPMARDLGPFGIRVVTIAPGLMMTPLVEKICSKEWIENDKKITPLGRAGTPEEFAQCVMSLCMNTYMTGDIIKLDGGRRS